MSLLRRKLSNCCCCKKPWLLKTLSGTWKETRRKLFLTCMLEEVWRTLCRKHAVYLFRLSRAWLVTRFPALHTDRFHAFPRFVLTGNLFSFALHWLATCFPALHTDLLHVSSGSALIGNTFSSALHWLVTCFPALHSDGLLLTCFLTFCTNWLHVWLHVFPRLALTGYLSSRAFHLVTCFPMLCTFFFAFPPV